MRYISLFLFVVVIGISSVAEGQKYDKSSPKYSEGQRVKQETLDWREKWPGLGCDSEESCMELVAQYVWLPGTQMKPPLEGGEEQGATTERIVELEAQLQAANEEITSLQEAHLEQPGLSIDAAGPCGKGHVCRDGTCSPCPKPASGISKDF